MTGKTINLKEWFDLCVAMKLLIRIYFFQPSKNNVIVEIDQKFAKLCRQLKIQHNDNCKRPTMTKRKQSAGSSYRR